MSDIWAVKTGRIYFIEVKRPGGPMSPEQKQFEKDAIAAGATYVRAESIEDVQAAGL
jgi:hypothetical protein